MLVKITMLLCCAPLFSRAQSIPHADMDSPGQAESQVELVRVTGSRLRKVDVEYALPVTVLDRQILEATGEFRLSDALRKLPYNNLGAQSQGFGIAGGEVLGFVDLRGLGPSRTLVLVNGRRLTLSGQSNGAIANLNMIPLSAVDRVEVLRDGASAVYGSDAISGVLNVILKSEFHGFETALGITDSRQNADEKLLSLAGGLTDSRLRFFWAVEGTRREAVTSAERAMDPSELLLAVNPTGDPGTWYAADWFGDGSGVPGPWTAQSGCPADRLQSFGAWRTVHPQTGEVAGPEPVTICALRLSDSNNWSPRLEASRAFVSTAYDLAEPTEVFTTLLWSRLQAQALLTTGGDLENAIAADNPINPAYDSGTATAPWPVSLYFGFQQPGDRDRQVESDYVSLLAGLRQTFDAGVVESALQYDRETTDRSIANLALRSDLREAIAEGAFNPFLVRNDPGVVDALLYKQRDRAKSTIAAFDASWTPGQTISLFSVLPLSWMIGGEFRRESFEFQPDLQDLALNVFGWLPGGYLVDAHRDVWSAYAEASLALPGAVEFGYAGRFDDYSLPAKSRWTHKLSLSWRPGRSLLFRANWGQGFRAPTLVELAAPAVPALAFRIVDRLGCKRAGGSPAFQECRPVTKLTNEVANPGLQPETSASYNAGFVWQISDTASFQLDAWGVDVKDQVTAPTAQQLLDLELMEAVPPGSEIVRNPGGFIEEVVRGRVNFPRVKARGVDLEFEGTVSLGNSGSLGVFSMWSFLTDSELTIVAELPAEDRIDEGTVPAWKSRTDFTWSRASFTVRAVVFGVDAFTEGQQFFSEWWSFDMNGSWRAPWNAELTMGVRNLTDKRPDNLSLRHHDYDGRSWYFLYRQYFGKGPLQIR